MSQTGSYITSLVWETTDAEGPTRSEYQINWNAMDGHLHDNRGAGRGVRGIQTTAAPAQTGDIQINGDTLSWWGASGSKVISAAASVAPVITGAASITSTGTTDLSGAASGATKVLDLVFTDEAAPAAPGAGKTVLYSVAGAPHYRSGASGIDTALGIYRLLGKGTATANQSVTSTVSPGTDVTSLTVTCTPDGTHDVKITVSMPDVSIASGSIPRFCLQKDGVIVDTAAHHMVSTGPLVAPIHFTYIDAAPTNASHTYKVSIFLNQADTLSTIHGDGTAPTNLILVEQVG